MHRLCCTCLQSTVIRSERSSLNEFLVSTTELILCFLLKATFSIASELQSELLVLKDGFFSFQMRKKLHGFRFIQSSGANLLLLQVRLLF